jgi:hypothetical protein
MGKTFKLQISGTPVSFIHHKNDDFISLSDIARFKDPERSDYIIQNWLRNRNTIELLGIWELLYNPDFNSIEFDGIKTLAGLNSFTMSPKQWTEKTRAVGMFSKPGRYGSGTYAHRDIAFEFASWVSVEFKMYLIKEFQRLKNEENDRYKLEWNLQRTLTKVNYQIHADAIRERLVPEKLTRAQISRVYAGEADLLNMALFGCTAKEWREQHPGEEGNIRDTATLEQLVVLSNLESLNAVFLKQGQEPSDRLQQLNDIAITQMTSLVNSRALRRLR